MAMSLKRGLPGFVGAMLMLVSMGVAAATPYDDAVAYWPLDDNAGTFAQEVRNDFLDASLVGASWTTPGKFSAAAVDLNGAGDYVVASDYNKSTSAMSVAAWAWADTLPTSGDAYHFLLHTEALFQVLIKPTGALEATFWNASGSPTTTLASDSGAFTTGEWHHVAWTFDGSTARLYFDGSEVDNGALAGLYGSSRPELGMGVQLATGVPYGSYPGYWDGKIDEVAVWDRELSDTEVAWFGLIPEPSALALMATALFMLRKRRG